MEKVQPLVERRTGQVPGKWEAVFTSKAEDIVYSAWKHAAAGNAAGND